MQRFKDILFVTASDSDSGAALERTVALAKNNQARLTVITIIDEIPANTKLLERVLSPSDLQANLVAEYQKRLEELIAPWNRNIKIQIKVLIGIPFLKIIREVLGNGRDLVIKAAESSGLLDRVFASDDMHLLRKCPCPVWLINSKSPKVYRRILAAVDVDDYYSVEELNTRHLLNLQVLEMASSLALSEFAELHIVHVWEAIGESAMRGAFVDVPEEKILSYVEKTRQQHSQNLNMLLAEVTSKLGQSALEYLKPQTHLLKGSPHKEIPSCAEAIQADLVVMGTVARTGIPGYFMGNTAETVLNRLDCSVLAIKTPGFITPVELESQVPSAPSTFA
jgi:nucleotide-binding universal stress UspA family protein